MLPTVARGTNAYHAVQAAPTSVAGQPVTEGDEGEADGDGAVGNASNEGLSGTTGGSIDHEMDVETVVSRTPSVSASKRKFSALGNELPSIQSATTSSVSLLAASASPRTSSLSLPLSSGYKSLKTGRSSASKNVMTALDAGFNQMGGSLQRFTEVFEKSLLPQENPAANHHDKALQLLQERDDELNFEEKIIVISHLTENPTAVRTYLALTDDALRAGWLQSIVGKARA